MEEILKQATEHHIPIVRPKTLELLVQSVKENAPQHILEIGTAIGYSAVQMLRACDGKLTSIEIRPLDHELAKSNLTRLGLIDRAELILGDAGVELKRLVAEGKHFDFVFLDGPKGQYLTYLKDLKLLLNKGGIIFADDVLFRGMVGGDDFVPHKFRTIVVNLRKYLSEVQKTPFESQILDIEDGICISKKVE